MTEPLDPDAVTEDGRAPVLGEDQAQSPPDVADGDSDGDSVVRPG